LRYRSRLQYWDDILRFIATIKLKETTASDLFRPAQLYSKKHGLLSSPQSLRTNTEESFILRVIDEPALRMAIERVLNGVEHIHRFTRAVSAGNPHEFLQELHHLLELSLPIQKLAEMDDPARREPILNALIHGEYDFSEERLRDTVGIKPTKLLD
jgi:Tn3 transposase DDE domain